VACAVCVRCRVGHWLAGGWLDTQPSCVAFACFSPQDGPLIDSLLARVGLARLPSLAAGQDGFFCSLTAESDPQTGEASAVYRICSPRWVALFSSESVAHATTNGRAMSPPPFPPRQRLDGDFRAEELEADSPLPSRLPSIASRTRSHSQSGIDSSNSVHSGRGSEEEMENEELLDSEGGPPRPCPKRSSPSAPPPPFFLPASMGCSDAVSSLLCAGCGAGCWVGARLASCG
jgi:hypothetical protein